MLRIQTIDFLRSLWNQQSFDYAAGMNVDGPVKGISGDTGARLDFNGLRRMHGSLNTSAHDDVRGFDRAGDIACLADDDGSVGIGGA